MDTKKEQFLKTNTKTNILVIGNTNWYQQHIHFFNKLHDKYNLEYIHDVQQANNRLWHNSYDMLLIEQDFCKENTIKLSKLSYARSKPSIILCNSWFMQLIMKLWKRFSNFTKTCCTMRKLMHIYYDTNKQLLSQIDNIASSNHSYRKDITLQIKKYFN